MFFFWFTFLKIKWQLPFSKEAIFAYDAMCESYGSRGCISESGNFTKDSKFLFLKVDHDKTC